MKTQTLLLTLALLLSCASHRSVSSLIVSIEEPIGPITNYRLKVEAIENDGIERITLEIPSLNISETFFPENKKIWVYERELMIQNKDGDYGYVQLIIIDRNGVEKVKKVKLALSTNTISL